MSAPEAGLEWLKRRITAAQDPGKARTIRELLAWVEQAARLLSAAERERAERCEASAYDGLRGVVCIRSRGHDGLHVDRGHGYWRQNADMTIDSFDFPDVEQAAAREAAHVEAARRIVELADDGATLRDGASDVVGALSDLRDVLASPSAAARELLERLERAEETAREVADLRHDRNVSAEASARANAEHVAVLAERDGLRVDLANAQKARDASDAMVRPALHRSGRLVVERDALRARLEQAERERNRLRPFERAMDAGLEREEKLRAELAAEREQRGQTVNALDLCREQAAAERARRERASDALRTFGVHPRSCSGWRRIEDAVTYDVVYMFDGACSCGLSAAIAEVSRG